MVYRDGLGCFWTSKFQEGAKKLRMLKGNMPFRLPKDLSEFQFPGSSFTFRRCSTDKFQCLVYKYHRKSKDEDEKPLIHAEGHNAKDIC